MAERGAFDEALGRLRCPACHAELARFDAAVRCERGHAFDRARQGYLSLMAGNPTAHAGDTAAMVEARERFLGAGHFEPLADALAGAIEAARAGCVVDLGAGTGWYLARALDRLAAALGIALDVSKPALRRAAQAHPRVAAVACDVWGELPLRDGAADAIVNVFAPRNGAEMARVLRPDGVAAIVTPTARHLEELVAPLGLLSVDERKEDRLSEQLEPHLAIAGREELGWEMRLDRDGIRDLVAMGPSAFHVDAAELERRVATLGEPIDVTASVTITRARSARRSGRR